MSSNRGGMVAVVVSVTIALLCAVAGVVLGVLLSGCGGAATTPIVPGPGCHVVTATAQFSADDTYGAVTAVCVDGEHPVASESQCADTDPILLLDGAAGKVGWTCAATSSDLRAYGYSVSASAECCR